MSTVITLKYSGSTSQPADDLLSIAEPAYSFASNKLWIGSDNSGTIVPVAIGGRFYTQQLADTPTDYGILVGEKAIVVDSNKKINEFFVDNLKFDGNVISSTDLNGPIQIDPAGTGDIILHADTQVTGDFSVTGAQNFTGQTTAASLNVLDLTSGRVTLVGASGELLDSAEFTYAQNVGAIDVGIVGTLSVDNIRLDVNTITTTDLNGNLNLTANGAGLIVIDTNTGFKVASGTLATRPSAVSIGNGVIRYNESDNRFEGTVSGSWTGLGGVVDVDQDTYIDAEESPDEDVLRFYTGGTERVFIDVNGLTINSGYALTVDNINVENVNVTNDTITINGSTITATGNAGGGAWIIDPAPAAGDDGGELIVRGNLQVTGTTTTVNSTVVEIKDPVIVLGDNTQTDALDRGIEVVYNDGTAKAGFIGWDRGVANEFTFIPDTSTGLYGDARFNNLALTGSITEIDGAAPLAGQILIGNGTNGDFEVANLTPGNSMTIVESDGGIELVVDPALAVDTADIADTGDGVVDYAPLNNNETSRGAATFASEQFSVSAGHVVITHIEGGTF